MKHKRTLVIGFCLIVSIVSAQLPFSGDGLFNSLQEFATLTAAQMVSKSVEVIMQLLSLVPNIHDQVDGKSVWPVTQAIHNSFWWIGTMFIVILTYQGVRYVAAADSPGGRAAAKERLKRLFVGMIIVSLSGFIYDFGIQIAQTLNNFFINASGFELNKLSSISAIALSGIFATLSCFLLPLTALIIVAMVLMLAARAVILMICYAFMPLILALMFSGLPMLQKLGKRGFNLFLAAILSFPIMSYLFFQSISILVTTINTSGLENTGEAMMYGSIAVAGLAVATISPLITLGLVEMGGSILQAGGTVVGALGGPKGMVVGGAMKGLGSVLTGVSKDTKPIQVGMPSQTREGIMRAVQSTTTGVKDYKDAEAKAKEEEKKLSGKPTDIVGPLYSPLFAAKAPGTDKSNQHVLEQDGMSLVASGRYNVRTEEGLVKFWSDSMSKPRIKAVYDSINSQAEERGPNGEQIRWSEFGGEWRKGPEGFLQTLKGGGLVAESSDGTLYVTDKGQENHQPPEYERTPATPFADNTIRYEAPTSKESYEMAREAGVAYGGGVIFDESNTTEDNISCVDGSYKMAVSYDQNTGTAHTYVNGQDRREYSNFNLNEAKIKNPTEIPKRIEDISKDSGLSPDAILHAMHDCPNYIGHQVRRDIHRQRHEGHIFTKDIGGGYYENMILDPKTDEIDDWFVTKRKRGP
jgi:hypothetical protein